ncbi:MAG: hypothetical protein U0Q11_26420 [Vicinamibacterales bacterium]
MELSYTRRLTASVLKSFAGYDVLKPYGNPASEVDAIVVCRPYRLPRTFKNDIFVEASKLSLDPNDFSFVEYSDGNGDGEELVHNPTGSFFRMKWLNGLRCLWRPAGERVEGFVSVNAERDALPHLLYWLRVVAAEHSAPDLWAAVAAERDLVIGDVPEGPSSFTPSELKVLRERLGLVEAKVRQLATDLTADQDQQLAEAFETAASAADHLTKKEWKQLFAGALLQTFTSLALTVDNLRQVVHFAAITIGPIVSRAASLLPSGFLQ